MAKITNIRERVHQPLRDALIRTSGNYVSNVQDRTDLFTVAGGDQGKTNLQNGSTLPSDQSMVVLALRTFLWFRNPQLRAEDAAGNITVNGDILPADFVANQNTGIGSAEDVHRLYFQASEQLLWSVGAGQKYSLTSMPSAYFPYAGGLHGRLPKAGKADTCCELFIVSDPAPSGDPDIVWRAQIPVVLNEGSCCPPDSFWLSVAINKPDLPGRDYEVAVVLWSGVPGAVGVSTYISDAYQNFGTNLDDVPDEVTFMLPIVDMGDPCLSITVQQVRLWSTTPPPPPPVDPRFFKWRSVSAFGNAACGSSTLIHWNNGTPEASSLTRLARAILIPPRQNILVSAQIVSYADNPQSSVATQGSRNLLSLTSNLNQQDYINKIVTMTIDGLLSRDVQ